MNLTFPELELGNIPSFRPGDTAYLVSWFANISNAPFSGNLNYSVWLSSRDTYDGSATYVTGFRMKNTKVNGKETIVDTPKIKIPCRPKHMNASQQLYMVVTITNNDANRTNNTSARFSAPLYIGGTACAD